MTIRYCNSKVINLSYNSSEQLEYIEYVCGDSTFRSTFIYSGSNITIQHYSGVDYHLSLSENVFTAYSSNKDASYSSTYSHKLTSTVGTTEYNEKYIRVNRIIGSKEVDRTIYTFLGVHNTNKFRAVNIADINGVMTRVQYENDKPRYSYEVIYTADGLYEDIFFSDNDGNNHFYKGTVSINKDEISGTQGINDGNKMTHLGGVSNDWSWLFLSNESLYGNFQISGWIEPTNSSSCTITVKDVHRGETFCEQTITNLIPDIWNYFTFRCYIRNPRDILVFLDCDRSNMITRDFRMTFEEGKIYESTDISHFTVMKDVLIIEGTNASNERIIYPDDELYYFNGNTQMTVTITAKDILKYKINQKYGSSKNEIYYDDCKGIITNTGTFMLGYKADDSAEIIQINIEDIAVGKSYIRNDKTFITKNNFYTDSDNNTYFASTSFINDTEIKRETYDEHFDIISSTVDGITTTYERANGLLISESVSNLYTRTITYAEDLSGNPTVSLTNEFNNTIVYTLDSVWGGVTKTTLSDGTTVTDTFDSDMCTRLSRSFTKGDSASKVHTFSYSDTNPNQFGLANGSLNYGFTYSAGSLTDVSKLGAPIEKHVLSNNDKTLKSYYPSISSPIYTVEQKTDNYGRTTEITGLVRNTYDINPTYSSNTYRVLGVNNGSGRLATSTDLTTGEVTKYAYDKDRVSNIGVFNSTGTRIKQESISYDDIGRVISAECDFKDSDSKIKETQTYYTSPTSHNADGLIATHKFYLDNTLKASTANTYDESLKRLTRKVTNIGGIEVTKDYNYEYTRLCGITHTIQSENGSTSHIYLWDRDPQLRTTIEHDYVGGGYTNNYVYDSYGQLVRENNEVLDKTFIYCYDNIGNITSVKTYAYTTAETPSGTYTTDSYTYDKDRLTKYGYNNISYNSIGYPISYGDIILEWQNGRLTKYYDEGDSAGIFSQDIVEFTYNAYGQRTSKRYEYYPGENSSGDYRTGFTTTYDYDNSGRLIREHITETYYESDNQTYELIYLYDESGMIGVMYGRNGAALQPYYYDRNHRGDVVAIYDANGNKKAGYAYDAFGNCRILHNDFSTRIAFINPIRYRGYYYDNETGLYFLNARYYSPEWRRFISPDDTAYLDPEIPNGLNLYCYCGNDPINYCDPSGHFALTTFGIGAIIGIVSAAVVIGGGAQLLSNSLAGETGVDLWQGVAGAALGTGANALALLLIPFSPIATIFASAGIGAIVQTSVDSIETIIRGKQIDIGQTIFDLGLNYFTTVAGNYLGSKLIPTNAGWFKPQHFLSAFTKPYGQKIIAQTLIGAGLSGIINFIKKFDWSTFQSILPAYTVPLFQKDYTGWK